MTTELYYEVPLRSLLSGDDVDCIIGIIIPLSISN